jgi:hypothetical protein
MESEEDAQALHLSWLVQMMSGDSASNAGVERLGGLLRD